jgi:O-antigen ligase
VNVAAATSPVQSIQPAWRNPLVWAKATDIIAVLIALSLPWSTSLVGILNVVWIIAVIPTIDPKELGTLAKRAICIFPLALFVLAVIGTLWSDAAWGVRLHAISPTAKLLMLPLLFYHYRRSERAMWVFQAFLISCALLMVMSWIVKFDPSLALKPKGFDRLEPGVFVKNYIDQSQEFALCAVVLAFPVITRLREQKLVPALLLGTLALSFLINMAFVVVSRTALVTMPIMLAVFALLHLRWRSVAIIACIVAALAGLAWTTSPQLRKTIGTFSRDYRLYKEQNVPTSAGLRIEFWEKSLRFFAEAPIIGHGSGSTLGLFERAVVGHFGATAEVIDNPHNQTLNVAIQWGTIGIVALYAMWLSHLLLFRGEGLIAWIGLMVVVQNIFTSLFNSHIFDFHEGWMYVLGVGIAGGTVLQAGRHKRVAEQASSEGR